MDSCFDSLEVKSTVCEIGLLTAVTRPAGALGGLGHSPSSISSVGSGAVSRVPRMSIGAVLLTPSPAREGKPLALAIADAILSENPA